MPLSNIVNSPAPLLESNHRSNNTTKQKDSAGILTSQFSEILARETNTSISQDLKSSSANSNEEPSNSKKFIPVPSSSGKDGTDLAYRTLAIEYEKAFYSFLWTSWAELGQEDSEKSLAEKMIMPDVIDSYVSSNTDSSQMGEIAQNIYDEIRKENVNESIKAGVSTK